MRRLLEAVVLTGALAAGACKSGPADVAPDPAASTNARGSTGGAGADRRIHLRDAPAEGDVDALVRAALAEATPANRRVVVYVGAKWCEPCRRFHQAAERGELDAAFPDVDMLVFDLDRDGERLASAGYVSKYIPLFALPAMDGRASGKQIEGGVKGEGAVGFIAPRLQKMLEE